jgi:pimeloyl-ACP methyl ester carboxylesterase
MSDLANCDRECAAGPLAQGQVDLPEALRRFEMEAVRGTLAAGRLRLRYYVWGSGPPLVFLHGAGDSSRSFLPAISRLSARFRCAAFDLPGQRGDGASLWRVTHETLVDSLFAFLDHLGASRAYLYASSFGATVALRAMRRQPERFPRAVLQGAGASRPLRRSVWWLSWLARLMPGKLGNIPRREKSLAAAHKEAFQGRPEAWWRAFLDWTAPTPIATLGHQGMMLHRLDLRPELPHIRQPVLLVAGERDRTMPLALTRELLEGLPNGGLVVLEGAGHHPYYTHPEMLTEVVRQFLTPPGESACPMRDVCHGAAAASPPA